MPAKPLSPEQKADAARLKAAFKEWQAQRRHAGLAASQDEVADELGFGQSALSQYLNGLIPLNPGAVSKFSRLLGMAPGAISPSIVAKAQADAAELLALSAGMTPAANAKSEVVNLTTKDGGPLKLGLTAVKSRRGGTRQHPVTTTREGKDETDTGHGKP